MSDGPVRMDDPDQEARSSRARSVLGEAGAADLVPRPWQHPDQPASDADLVRFAAWKAAAPASSDPHVLVAGLQLLASARAELDQIEAALLFAARAAGLTWPQLAQALGLGSAQAAQQRAGRVLSRSEGAG